MGEDRSYAPLPPDVWPEGLADLKEGFAGRHNIYRVMAHDPDLLKAWAPLRAHLVTRNALGPERLEIVILRTAARLSASYEWAHHVDRAGKLGIDRARIDAIAGDPETMRAEDALLAQAVDDLLDITRLAPERVAALDDLIGKEGVLDLIATVGFYVTLGFIVNSFDVPLDDGIAPARIPTRP